MSGTEADQAQIWEESYQPVEHGAGEDALVVDVAGFEGPLDLLLTLARTQKVDISRISILALAEQYLTYIEQIRRLRLEVAADYLVMAAWLAYLKSRLLLPAAEGDDEPSGEELAEALAFRLRRLEAMREAGARLTNRNRLGRDVFARGQPEPVVIRKTSQYSATLYDLLSAYAAQRQQLAISVVQVKKRQVWSLQEARDVLTRLIGQVGQWTPLSVFMSPYLVSPEMRATVTASAFGASLELAREGKFDLRQTEPFAPLYIRDRLTVAAVNQEAGNG
jgi:segregation and condensation protein A